MKIKILLLLMFFSISVHAQTTDNDNIENAKDIITPFNYCSDPGAFTNTGASDSGIPKSIFWQTAGKDVWFKFTATRTDVLVAVNGVALNNAPALLNPTIAMYLYDKLNDAVTPVNASMTAGTNETTLYKGALAIGTVYYIRVSAENDQTGNFRLCINNYNPPNKQGQDCSNASFLCNKQTITEVGLSGAGANNQEVSSSCLTTESNSAWYLWKTGKPGTLTFTITPSVKTDDIDWVLYDLGVNGDCSALLPENLMRCVIGNGVTCNPFYYLTGLSMDATDFNEAAGCVPGQDGFVKFIDMLPGHNYALLVDNYSNANNGFTLEFGGTAEFNTLKGALEIVHNNPCLPTQSYTFTNASENYSSLKWSFGEDANIAASTAEGPHTITYASSGLKTVVLEVFGQGGCSEVVTRSFVVTLTPATPIVTSDKSSYCLTDTMQLSVAQVKDASYLWTGPLGFTATTPSVNIPLTSTGQSGTYSVRIIVGDCTSAPGTITIPAIIKNPVSNFSADPPFPGNYAVPLEVQFTNRSINADSYLWDFGDGTTSTDPAPLHTYTRPGKYTVKLTSFTNNGCSHSKSLGNMLIKNHTTLFTPGAFSPNGDGINDFFVVNITNLRRYEMQIFNRYGDKIYYSNAAANGWDGTFKGQRMPAGVYYYRISGVDLSYKPISFSGSVTLLR